MNLVECGVGVFVQVREHGTLGSVVFLEVGSSGFSSNDAVPRLEQRAPRRSRHPREGDICSDPEFTRVIADVFDQTRPINVSECEAVRITSETDVNGSVDLGWPVD